MENMLMSGLAGLVSSLDWLPSVLFLAFTILYALLPVMGYRREQRGDLLLALYLLAAYDAVTIVHSLAQYFMSLGQANNGPGAGVSFHLVALVGIVKSSLVLAAKVLTITCIRSIDMAAQKSGSGSSAEFEFLDPADPHHEAERELARAVQLNHSHHRDQAVTILQQIVVNYPNSKAAAKARSALRKLES